MKVTRVVNEVVNSGVKNNKQWSQASVQLSDGQIVRIFNPVMVGDEVESVTNGQYTNWSVRRDFKSQSTVSSDVDKIVNQMSKDIQTLAGRVDTLAAEVAGLKMNTIEVESQVSDEDDFPEDFLKISKSEETSK